MAKAGMDRLRKAAQQTKQENCCICAAAGMSHLCGDIKCNNVRGMALRAIYKQIEDEHRAELKEARDARDIALRDALRKRKLTDEACGALIDFRAEVAGILGIAHEGMADEVQQAIMSELDKRLMPQGMEWPRFEDGEKVITGSAALNGYGVAAEVATIRFCTNPTGAYKLHTDDGTSIHPLWSNCSTRVKRPEAMGADGLPIKVGETVYNMWGKPYYVYRVDQGAVDTVYGFIDAGHFIHTQPNTQKRKTRNVTNVEIKDERMLGCDAS